MRRLCPLMVFVVLAACGGTASGTASHAVRPSPTGTAPGPSEEATATLTLGFGHADGPGESVSHATATAGGGPQLVSGVLLQEADGTVWLCDVLLESSPRQCAEPRLLIQNYGQDLVMVEGREGFYPGPGPASYVQGASGVRWVERQQLFGVVGL